MARTTSRYVEAQLPGLDKKTLRELRRLLKRDKITLAEFMRRGVQAYDFIYPGPAYRPPAPAE